MNDAVEVEEVEEAEIDQEIKDAFDGALSEEKDEDDVKMEMIQAGATFKNVTRFYNKFMIEAGLAMSAADRKAAVDETLADRDLSTEDGFDLAVTALVAAIQGSTDRSAFALIRSYAKKNELECYSKPKTEGGSRNPFVRVFHEALIDNPSMDEQGLKDIIGSLEPDHQVNPNRWFSQHNNIRKTANAIAEKLAA